MARTKCGSLITSHWKMSPLNTLLHMNVPLQIILNKQFMLTVHQFRMIPILKTLAVLHTKQIYYQLIMIRNIMQENIGNNFWKSSQQVYKADTEATYTEIEWNNFPNKVILTAVISIPFVLVRKILILICSVYPMQTIYFLEKYLQKTQSSMFVQKGYQDAIFVFLIATTTSIYRATQTEEKIYILHHQI